MTPSLDTFTQSGVTVNYRFQSAKDDRRHLIVIFSGFRAFGTFDFGGNTATAIKGNVLWIEDRFNEQFAYYLRQDGQSSIETAVYSLIEKTRLELALLKSQTTVAGFSKGGTASMYYGLKYGYQNIVSTVPQFQIGTYVRQYWPKTHKAMLGTLSETATHDLDELLPQLLRKKLNKKVNIYLFSSLEDPQHSSQVEPYIKYLRKYRNFNYVVTNSPMVKEHDKVTRYNVPLLLSLLAMFSDNISPSIGMAVNGLHSVTSAYNHNSGTSSEASNVAIHNMDGARIDKGRLFIDGYAFVQGLAAKSYDAIETSLVLQKSDIKSMVQLASVANKDLSYSHFRKEHCDYTFAGFTTFDRRGISLSHLPDGIYDLKLDIDHQGARSIVNVASKRQLDLWGPSDSSLVNYKSSVSFSKLTKRPILAKSPSDAYVELTHSWSKGALFHVEGYFVIPGAAASNYSTTSFYLVLTEPESDSVLHIIDLAAGNRVDAGAKVNDPWTDYSKAYFATPKYEGVDLSSTSPGVYDCWVTARYADSVFSTKLPVRIDIRVQFPQFEPGALPSVGIIGSCVTRDNFNSRVTPNWKKYFHLHGSQYQMSLLSLLSKPVEVAEDAFADVDTHTAESTMRDFRKSYLYELREDQPDILIVDLYADARFGCISVGGSLVTNNAWKLHLTKYFEALSDADVHYLQSDFEGYLELFELATIQFETFRKNYLPKTKIFLNSARNVNSRIEGGRRVLLSRTDNERINGYWDVLDEVFMRNVSVYSTFSMPRPLQADSNHPWGPGPVHYESKFYQDFQNWVLNSLGTVTTVDIERLSTPTGNMAVVAN